MKFLFLLFLLFTSIDANGQSFPSFPRPVGIYAIGTTNVSGIRDYPFVDGFVMRIDWSAVEPQKDVYDFSAIDAVVRRLDSLGKKLTLDVFRMATPDYILKTPGVQTHTLQLSQKSFETAVPWDTYALERIEKLHEALSAHMVFSRAEGIPIPFFRHPVLKQIDATPIGTNGIRDINHSITTHPTYSRKSFVRSIVHTAEIVRRYFPDTFTFVAMFGISDSVAAPPLSDVIRDSLTHGINVNKAKPMLGFFQENLSCNGPLAIKSNILYHERDSTFTMYQMLQGWQTPFLDPVKTDTCKTDSSGPDVAMLKALAVTNCLYFEIYTSDLDYPGYGNMFERMHDSLWSIHSTITDVEANSVQPAEFELQQNFPNPFSRQTAISFTVPASINTVSSGRFIGPTGKALSIRVYDVLGREVATLFDGIPAPGVHTVIFDPQNTRGMGIHGMYFYRLAYDGRLLTKSMILQ